MPIKTIKNSLVTNRYNCFVLGGESKIIFWGAIAPQAPRGYVPISYRET